MDQLYLLFLVPYFWYESQLLMKIMHSLVECLGQSSKHIIVSKPLSLNLSAIDIPIKGNVYDNNEDEE